MTGEIFNEWLQKIDNQFRSQNRNILLLADNFSGHKVTTKLTNVNVQFYPPNCTAKIQPMDQGVIANFKHFYRSGVIKSLVEVLDNNLEPLLIDMRGAIERSVTAWNKVKPSSITNCFVKAGHKLKANHPKILMKP